jgi:CDP-paratose 2-epimerase
MNLPRLQAEGVRFVHGDVRSLADLAAIRPAPDLILECSAEPSALAGYGGSPEYLIHTNLTGCFHCLEIARQAKAAFLFVSTSRVYPVAPVNSLSFEGTETRYRLRPAQTVAGASEYGITVSAVRGWNPQRDARRTIGDIAAWIDGQGDPLREVLFG